VLERSLEHDVVVDLPADERHDNVPHRTEPCRSPRVDLRIEKANRRSPLAVGAVPLSRFSAWRDPDVLDRPAAERPGEMPLSGDRDPGAVRLVLRYGYVPAARELGEQRAPVRPAPAGAL